MIHDRASPPAGTERSQLERVQAAVAELRQVVKVLEATAPETRAAAIAEAQRQLEEHQAAYQLLQTREATARDRLDELHQRSTGTRTRWWTSQFAYAALVPAAIGVIWVSFRLLDVFDWNRWAHPLGLWLIVVPVVVNGTRLLLTWLRRSG